MTNTALNDLAPAAPAAITPITDTTAPQLLAESAEVNKRTEVSPNAVTLSFNENIKLGNGVIELHKAADNSLVETFKNGVGSQGGYISASKSQLTVDPFVNLSLDTQYYLTISDHAIKDSGNNAFAGVTDTQSLRFTTQKPDNQAPTLLPTDVKTGVNKQTDIALNALSISFNEPVQLSDGVIELHKAADNSLVETFKNGVGSEGGRLGLSKAQLTIDPFTDLSLNTAYYLTFSEHVIKDLSGNAFAGNANTLNFNTLKPDTQAPTLVPAEQQQTLNNNGNSATNLVIGFNETVQLAKGVIELHKLSDNSLVDSFVNGVSSHGGSISAYGAQINIGFAQPLLPATQYYVTNTNDALTDSAGNAFVPLSNPTAFNFTTPEPDVKAPVLYNTNPLALPTGAGTIIDDVPVPPGHYYGMTPVSDEKDLSLTTDLTLRFNEAVQLGAGEIVLHNASDGSVVEAFKAGVGSQGGYATLSQWGSSSAIFDPPSAIFAVSINPYADLSLNTQYYLTISGDAIRDNAGNAFAGFVDPHTLSFTSIGLDTQAPVFSGLYTAYDLGQDGKVLATRLMLVANEALQLGSGDIVLHKASDNSVVESFSHGVGSQDGYISTAYGSFSLVTYAALTAGEDYYLTLADNAITDKVGNTVTRVTDANTLSFTQPLINTVDNQPLIFYPQSFDNQLGVSVSGDLYFNFNHPVTLGTGNIVLHNADNNRVVETFSNGIGSAGGVATASKSDISINPAVDLAPATQYYLTIDKDAISDAKGEVFKGFADADTLSFFTAGISPIVTPPPPPPMTPQVIYSYPLDNQGGLAIEADLNFTFDRDIQLSSGAIELHKLSDNSLVERFDHGVGSAGGNIRVSTGSLYMGKTFNPPALTINPFANLAPATAYYLTVADNAIIDTAGHAFAGFSDPRQFNFTAEAADHTAPVLIGSTPFDNQANVIDAQIYLSFNESVRLGQGVIAIHKVSDGSIVESFSQGHGSAGGSLSVNESGLNIIPSLANFTPGTQYYLTIADNAVTDKWGNAFAGFSDPATLNFRTAPPTPLDTTAPKLLATVPEDNQSHIAVSADISLRFNEVVRLGSGRIELHKASDASIVETFLHGVGSSGGLILIHPTSSKTGDGVASSLRIIPDANLQLGTQYYLTVSADAVTDLAGNAYSGFSDPNSFNFKTVPNELATKQADYVDLTYELGGIELVGVSELSAIF